MSEYRSTGSGENGEVSILDAAALLLRKCYWLILVGVLCGLITYFGVTFLITPKFESRVSFYVYNSSDGSTRPGTVNNSDLQAAESLATTYSKILESNSVLDAVLGDLEDSRGMTRKELSKMVDVSVVSDTQLLEVVITSTDAEFACRIAQAFVNVAPTEIVRITKAGGVEVVDRPEVASEKSSPRTVFDTAIGAVAGVIVTAVIMIINMLSDTTLYTPDDIEKLVGATVLVQIPEIHADEEFVQWKLVEGGSLRDENRNK